MNNYQPKCHYCGKFCYPYDQSTAFGCKDPEEPEPLDPEFTCQKCYPKALEFWRNWFASGLKTGDWEKSKAEITMARKFNLVWVGSGGCGILCSQEFLDSYRYYPKRVYKTFSKLPYYGWCKKCGYEKKGGYCSNRKCEDRFVKTL